MSHNTVNRAVLSTKLIVNSSRLIPICPAKNTGSVFAVSLETIGSTDIYVTHVPQNSSAAGTVPKAENRAVSSRLIAASVVCA